MLCDRRMELANRDARKYSKQLTKLEKKRAQALAELQWQEVGPRPALQASSCVGRGGFSALKHDLWACLRSRLTVPAQGQGVDSAHMSPFKAIVHDADLAIEVRLSSTNHPSSHSHPGPAARCRSRVHHASSAMLLSSLMRPSVSVAGSHQQDGDPHGLDQRDDQGSRVYHGAPASSAPPGPLPATTARTRSAQPIKPIASYGRCRCSR